MKVTTDACILGAWAPLPEPVRSVLDIGTGTGLLALMLAQRSQDTSIDAIELDEDAAGQARANVMQSPWAERINVLLGDVRGHAFKRKYDLIISNPPFFNNSLLGDKEQKNKARHTLSLTYNDLLAVAEQRLSDDGNLVVLLPYPEYLQWQQLCEAEGWCQSKRLSVYHTAYAKVNRVISVFGKNNSGPLQENKLVIYDDAKQYTPEFTALLSPFYLHL